MKHGKPLARSTRLQRGKPIKRGSTPMKQRNAKRGGHMFPKNVDHDRRTFMRGLHCCVTGAATGELVTFQPGFMPDNWRAITPYRCHVIVAHIKSRGSGGPDVGNIVPLDALLHDYQGRIGWRAFAKQFALRADLGAHYEAKYQRALLGQAV